MLKLDSSVDKTYKRKYFPGSNALTKPAGSAKTFPAGAVPSSNAIKDAISSPSQTQPPTSIAGLIDGFASWSIAVATDTVDEVAAPLPCPISTVPSEVLIEILFQAALTDFSSFGRLAQVCKRFAFLVTTEERIWQRLCYGPELGFGGMHYSWACDVVGRPLPGRAHPVTSMMTTFIPFPLSPAYPTYRHNLRYRPRIRFNGCYISTVNYVRPGASSATQVTWNTPVHIVTYYRYLRVFRDGTVISLVSTHEPAEIVHHLTKENLPFRSGDPASVGLSTAPLPGSVFQHAVRGRWRLGGCPFVTSFPQSSSSSSSTMTTTTTTTTTQVLSDHEEEHGCSRDHFIHHTDHDNDHDHDHDDHHDARHERDEESEREGNIHIQTEGVNPNYLFAMHLYLPLRTTTTTTIISSSSSSLPSSTIQRPSTTTTNDPTKSSSSTVEPGLITNSGNKKLLWRNYSGYNRLLRSWHHFNQVSDDRPFYWARVKSWSSA